jgi:hypothetical protein
MGVKQEVPGVRDGRLQPDGTTTKPGAEVVEPDAAHPLQLLLAIAPPHQHRMLGGGNGPLVFDCVSLRNWAFDSGTADGLVRAVSVEAMVAALLVLLR